MRYYPIFLNLKGRPVAIIGAGEIAFQKIPALLESEAKIKVIAPEALHEIEALAKDHRLEWIKRGYETSDIEGMSLVISATDDNPLQERIAAEARARHIWVNVVDVTPLCDFIAPAIVARGDLQIAISTGGASPALARFIREKLEPMFGPEYTFLTDTLQRHRAEILKLPKPRRQAIWGAIITEDFLARLKREGLATAEVRIQELIHEHSSI